MTDVLQTLVGRTIAEINRLSVEGAYGLEPAVQLVFEDGTDWIFVLPGEEEEEEVEYSNRDRSLETEAGI